MNKCAIVSSLEATSVNPTFTAGKLLIVGNGAIVKTGAVTFAKDVVLDILCGIQDGDMKAVGKLNPANFNYTSSAYTAAVLRTQVVGYVDGVSAMKVASTAISTNLGRAGVLSVTVKDRTSSMEDRIGKVFADDIIIEEGDTRATIIAKLVSVATSIVAKINAKYGAGTLTLTTDSTANSELLTFAQGSSANIKINLDGIFDGTGVTTTVGKNGPSISTSDGLSVRAAEMVSAVKDGYNPNQIAMYSMFNLDKYLVSNTSLNYDVIQITSQAPRWYEMPSSGTEWVTDFVLYIPNTTPGTKAALTTTVETLLAAIKAAN